MSNMAGLVPTRIVQQPIVTPDIPIEEMVGLIVLLLNTYGIEHQLPYVEPTGALNGDKDIRTQSLFFTLKALFEDLSREHTHVQAEMMFNGRTGILTLKCF